MILIPEKKSKPLTAPYLVIVSHTILNVVEKVVHELLLKDFAVLLCTDTNHQQPNMQMSDREPCLEVVG